MTSITLTSGETGRTFTFSSQEAREAAEAWYNGSISKPEIVAFCAAHGVDITEPTDGGGTKLVEDWADISMELYALVAAH